MSKDQIPMLIRPIPDKIKDRLKTDPWMLQCCICGAKKSEVKIEWHHNFQWAGKRTNDWWAILPLCEKCHDQARNSLMKEKLDFIMFIRAGLEIEKYPSFSWFQRRVYVIKQHGDKFIKTSIKGI